MTKFQHLITKLLSWLDRYQFEVIAGFLLLFGIIVRLNVSYFISGDYVSFLRPWMNQIVENGGFASLRFTIGDYTPPYMYLLTILSYFPSASENHPFLFGIKFYSLVFDLLLVVAVYLNVRLLHKTHGHQWGVLAGLLTFFLPTVILNSAYWGQIDASYTAFSLFALYYLQKEKLISSMLWYGVALSFKLQSIFFLPVFILYFWFKYRGKLHYFFLIPVVYYGLAIPSLIAGRSFLDITLIYVNQAENYRALTLNMPNLYQWLPNRYDDLSGMGFAVFASLMGVVFLTMTMQKTKLSASIVIPLAFWSVLMANFFLPAVHERYLFGADITSIILLFMMPKAWIYPVVTQFISLLAYTPFLFGTEIVKHEEVAVVYLLFLAYVNYQLIRPLLNVSLPSLKFHD
jgi:Gpi18-like mannosyltransferase